MISLPNKIILITGGGHGLSRAIALAYVDAGAHVVVASRLRDQLDEVATTIRTKGHHALAVEANISKSESLAQMVAAAGQKFGLFLYLP